MGMIGGERLEKEPEEGNLCEQPSFMWKRTSYEGAVKSCHDTIQKTWPIPALTL